MFGMSWEEVKQYAKDHLWVDEDFNFDNKRDLGRELFKQLGVILKADCNCK